MTYLFISMELLKQILLLHSKGVSRRKIALQLGIYKGTVNKYVGMALKDAMSIEDLLKLEDHELQARFCSGNTAYTDSRFEFLSSRIERYAKELENDRHLTCYQLWLEYAHEAERPYSYAQFCYHISQHKRASRPSMVMGDRDEGGKRLEVDFAGDTMSYVDQETGEVITVQMFVASLPASGYDFAMAVPSQKVEDFLHAMEECFRFIGGVPTYVVTDNLKAAVTKSDRYQPTINEIMLQFANHYGFSVIPTRPAGPKGKPNAEGTVKLTYQRVYAPLRHMTFFSLEELNKAIAEKMLLHNQRRMQQHPYTREERFLSVDKPNLSPVNTRKFEIRSESMVTVQSNSHIYFGRDKHYYSVDYHNIVKKVKVVYTQSMIEIFLGTTKLASYLRDRRPGAYTSKEEHLPSYFGDYQMASPQRYIERGYKATPILGKYFEGLFSTRNGMRRPEIYYKSCDGLLHLQKVTDAALFHKACEIAISMGQYNYHFVFQMVDSRCMGYVTNPTEDSEAPENSNARGSKYYN